MTILDTNENALATSISSLDIEPVYNLINTVRDTKTLEGDNSIYSNAEVTIKTFDPNDLYPTAKYVLTSNLNFVSAMRTEVLESSGIDIFNLDRICETGPYVIAPPIVEISDGVPAIVDGLHRCTLAKQLGKNISVIFVNGVDPTYPIISTPVDWKDVIQYDIKPEKADLLRNVRPGIADSSQSLRTYYRDFSYLGSLGRRPRAGQNS